MRRSNPGACSPCAVKAVPVDGNTFDGKLEQLMRKALDRCTADTASSNAAATAALIADLDAKKADLVSHVQQDTVCGMLLCLHYITCMFYSQFDAGVDSSRRQLLVDMFDKCLVVEGEADSHEPIDERKHRCKECKKLFRNKIFAVKHLYNKHADEVLAEAARVKGFLDRVVDICLYFEAMKKAYDLGLSSRRSPFHSQTVAGNPAHYVIHSSCADSDESGTSRTRRARCPNPSLGTLLRAIELDPAPVGAARLRPPPAWVDSSVVAAVVLVPVPSLDTSP
jgi:hypothetical protein